MRGWWRLGKWTVLIMFLHIIAILIFTKGFLLTRTELPHSSNCSDLSESPCLSSSSCWTKPVVDRLIIIVLDALRFDFVAPSSFFEQKHPWMDKLKVLQRVALEKPSSAKIFKAVADPPTTSLQRLKGLTTGALPTFIDVGNSFGAPAIVEDNFINQLIQNGKRVVMMGDDTWTQLFPNHFNKSYPYPSFNVKDLDTVDNGCIEHLLPSLDEQDWDVLIAHFLGVDHAGHIYGVDSTPMIEKLEQYNAILEKVIEVLQKQSGPGKLHENTLLLVMGDHGQTLNGDHGGGSAEEVETSIFAMSFKDLPSVPSEFDSSSCKANNNICISSIQQLDFAVTVSSLLGVPFPFGSIGRVNPELYALAVGTWNLEDNEMGKAQDQIKLEEWMQNYVNVLCINSWQVKRYIDVYSALSVIGFSSEDIFHISDLYAKAEENWLYTKNLLLYKNESYNASLPDLKRQIVAYFNFLSYVAELARSKWTEFNLKMMGTGIGIMLLSLYIHFLAIKKVNKSYGVSLLSSKGSGISFGLMFASFIVVIRACSLLSNSFILGEGKVANFLLATTGIITLRYSFIKKEMLLEATIFLLSTFILRIAIEAGLSKQAATSQFLNVSSAWMLGISISQPVWTYMAETVPILALIILGYFLYKAISSCCCWGIPEYVIMGTILCYLLIALHWATESNVLDLALLLKGIEKNYIPRTIYAIGLIQLSLLAFVLLFSNKETSNYKGSLFVKMIPILSACSSTVIILLGKQGPLVALGSIVAGYCIMRLEGIEQHTVDGAPGISILDPLPIVQWNLLAVCLFFATGHWCAFDGLRYGAAFIGFDEFILVRQAILLAIDTFGFSHILSVFGLPLFVACPSLFNQTGRSRSVSSMKLFRILMMYGLITATTATATILCVAVQRRHLMVWGLFAPKFVFDVVGLILTDVLIFWAFIYYF
ncbi:GPI ethanolamine phosphate transferase 3 isoform X2 [Durio zibethinus]|uniref:GPI ethanolamine phosphate transferase 3 isoform X2 n=1 Tax=Durio zibethinus TaxID=66656 RepID=A0A6P5Z9I4_DURZI|nr:GPI ethanolamine phosphate transferase 3 isoform X2 [Durio zibethinus]